VRTTIETPITATANCSPTIIASQKSKSAASFVCNAGEFGCQFGISPARYNIGFATT